MPGYDFLLQAMGGLMSVTGEPDGRPLKAGAAVVDLICGLLATIGIQAALAEGGGRHVEVSLMDSALAALLNQGSAWVSGGVVPAAARQPPPEHRPVRDLRGRRPAVRGRGRQRPPVRAPVRGGRAGRACRPTRASRPTRRAWRTSTRSPTAFERRVPHRAGRPLGRALRAASVPVGPINRVDEAFALAADLGMEPTDDSHGVPLITPPLRLDGDAAGDPPPAAAARRARRRDQDLAR